MWSNLWGRWWGRGNSLPRQDHDLLHLLLLLGFTEVHEEPLLTIVVFIPRGLPVTKLLYKLLGPQELVLQDLGWSLVGG